MFRFGPPLGDHGHTLKRNPSRAVVSLEEAEGHQHLAGGHGGGCEQMSPLPLKGSGFCTFLIQNPAF